MSGASKANQRQSRKRAGYYTSQKERTKANKLIAEARHIVRFNDFKAADRLKQRPAIDRQRAATIVGSGVVSDLLNDKIKLVRPANYSKRRPARVKMVGAFPCLPMGE